MSTEPLNRRNILEMDQEITRLRRAEKGYKADIGKLMAELDEAVRQLAECRAKLCHSNDDIIRLQAQLKAAREALEFYADEKNYNDDGAPYSEVVREGQECDELDLGDVAKAELEGGKT